MKKRTCGKKITAVLLAAVMTLAASLTSPAADVRTPYDASTWVQGANGWRYIREDGSFPVNEWVWIRNSTDSLSRCYFFDSNGNLIMNAITPDGSRVDETGAWVVNGVVQERSSGSQYLAPYGGEIMNGASIQPITLSTYLTSILDQKNSADGFPNRTLIRGDEEGKGTRLYTTMNNGTQIRIEIADATQTVVSVAGPARMIFKGFPDTGIEENALYQNMALQITSTVPLVISPESMAPYFGIEAGTFQVAGMTVVNDRLYDVYFLLTPGNDGLFYIYPESPVYMRVQPE